MTIVPVINKVDLQGADVEMVEKQLEEQFDMRREDVIHISAKTGLGVDRVIEAVIGRIPPPKIEVLDDKEAFKAFLFDSKFIHNRGVMCLVKVVAGVID